MKYFATIVLLIAFSSCSPNQKLIEENELLKTENLELKAEAEKQTELALQAAAEARMAQAEAEKQAEMANLNLEEANKQSAQLKSAIKKLENCK
ncbi:hypothetical protein [Ekhidna sp.]